MRRLLLCCALILLCAILGGCGNKGPLVLPDAPSQPASTVAPAAATSAD